MSDFKQWFHRCIGDWTSQRRYIYNMKTKKPVNLTTDFTILESNIDEWDYTVMWKGQTKGTMHLLISGDQLHRSVGYFTEKPTSSLLRKVDYDTIALYTKYDGMRFREEIRLLNSDDLRLRQTIGYNLKTGEPTLVGQYFEERITR